MGTPLPSHSSPPQSRGARSDSSSPPTNSSNLYSLDVDDYGYPAAQPDEFNRKGSPGQNADRSPNEFEMNNIDEEDGNNNSMNKKIREKK